MYIADDYNHRIRKVTVSTGIITTIAGSGSAGFTGDNAAATSTTLNNPQGVAVDLSGMLARRWVHINHQIKTPRVVPCIQTERFLAAVFDIRCVIGLLTLMVWL